MSVGEDQALLVVVQQKLANLGFLQPRIGPLELDDPLRAALRRLQEMRGLPVTGQLDAATLGALLGPVCGHLAPEGHAAPRPMAAGFSLVTGGPIWNKQELTYQFAPLPPGWAAWDIIGGINQALQAWAVVSPFQFKQVPSGADFTFRFDGVITQPDGTSLPVSPPAIAFTGSNQISFLPTVNFTSVPGAGTDIVTTALHELGHLLGLGHSANQEAVMYFQAGTRTLSADDIAGIQSLYGAPPIPVPGWFGDASSGADLVIDNFQPGDPPRLDMIVGHVDNPAGADTLFLRVGWGLDANGIPTLGWGPILPFGGPIGYDTQGLALATGFINGLGAGGTSALDLVVAWMDNPGGENQLKYRIGFNLDASGMNPASISSDLTVDGPWGSETAGLAAAIFDISRSGRPDLILAWIDNPDGENRIYYKIGWDLDLNGVATSWSPRMEVFGWTGAESGGLGIAVGDFRGNGRPDLAVFWVDEPGDNVGYVRIGRDLDPTGFPLGHWDFENKIPGWWGTSTTGAGAAFANLRGLLRPDLVVLNLDGPPGEDRAYYRVLSPPLATWNLLRQRTLAPVRVERLAAVSPTNEVIAVGFREEVIPPAAQAGVSFLLWDQTNLAKASPDVREFLPSPTLLEARPDSPIALAVRLKGQVDAFWIGVDHQVRTTAGTGFGPGVPATTIPNWPAGTALPNTLPARASSPPGSPPVSSSPLAAASLNTQHLAVIFVGREDEILTQTFTQAGGWGPAAAHADIGRVRPVTALAAEVRSDRVFIYWVDGAGAIWEKQLDQTNTTTPTAAVAPAGSVDPRSNLAAVSKDSDHMDLFWIDPGGRLMSTFWTSDAASWQPPFEVGSGRRAALPGSVTCVSDDGVRVQLFWEEGDRSVWTTWWTSRPDNAPVAWSPPTQVLVPGTTLGGRDLVAVSRQIEHIRLFLVEKDRQVAETYWGEVP